MVVFVQLEESRHGDAGERMKLDGRKVSSPSRAQRRVIQYGQPRSLACSLAGVDHPVEFASRCPRLGSARDWADKCLLRHWQAVARMQARLVSRPLFPSPTGC